MEELLGLFVFFGVIALIAVIVLSIRDAIKDKTSKTIGGEDNRDGFLDKYRNSMNKIQKIVIAIGLTLIIIIWVYPSSCTGGGISYFMGEPSFEIPEVCNPSVGDKILYSLVVFFWVIGINYIFKERSKPRNKI